MLLSLESFILDIPFGFWPSCHSGKTEDSSGNTHGHTCLCDSSTKPTVSPGSNSTRLAKNSPMSNIERDSASGEQGPPQRSIGVHSTHPVLHPQCQHAQEEAQCSTSPEIPQNWLHGFKGIAGFPLGTRPAWLQASTWMWALEENPIWILTTPCYICWKNFLRWFSYIIAQPWDTSQALHSIETHGYQTPVPLQPASFSCTCKLHVLDAATTTIAG